MDFTDYFFISDSLHISLLRLKMRLHLLKLNYLRNSLEIEMEIEMYRFQYGLIQESFY